MVTRITIARMGNNGTTAGVTPGNRNTYKQVSGTVKTVNQSPEASAHGKLLRSSFGSRLYFGVQGL